jgi:hypothetical protein
MTLKQESTVSFAALLFAILTCSNTSAEDAKLEIKNVQELRNPSNNVRELRNPSNNVRDLSNPSNPRVNIGSTVEIEVTKLDDWLKEKNSNPSKLILHLDGLPLAGLVMSRPKPNFLSVRLQPTSESRSTWSQLLGRIKEDQREFQLSR